jgi:hypothetical protein
MELSEELKKKIEEAKNPKKPDENCDHDWKQTGYWDGIDKNSNWVGGPMAKCTKCGGAENFDWEEWNAIPKEKKIELNPRPDDD